MNCVFGFSLKRSNRESLRFIKLKIRLSVYRKTYIIFENGCLALLAMLVLHRAKLLASNQSVLALGVAPMRVVSRWCRCVVQRLCATDCKRPCLVRAAAPHSAPARTPGVYAQRLCTMQSQPSIHSLSRGEGVWGFGKDAEIERPKALQDAKPTKRSYRDREQALF